MFIKGSVAAAIGSELSQISNNENFVFKKEEDMILASKEKAELQEIP
jgi:hypothetical protein